MKQFIILLLFFSHLTACRQKEILKEYTVQLPRSYVCYRAKNPIEIDGTDKEKDWKNVPWSDAFTDIEGKKTPLYETRLKMLWDREYLYFFAKLEEPHIWGTLTKRDTVIFYNNDFEIFIDPDGDTHNYYEFEMNALNTVWDLMLLKPYREHAGVIDSWDIVGLKTGVHIEGTLNDPTDLDKFWSVEIAMPWSVLLEAATESEFPSKSIWRINFSRVNWQFELSDKGKYVRKKDKKSKKFLPEYNWVWSPQGVINMHEPEKWGYVYFSPKNAGEKDIFIYGKDEKLKWYLFELYRMYNVKDIIKLKNTNLQPVVINGKEIHPKLEINRTGWVIYTQSPFTQDTWNIAEDGRIWRSN